jgi:predicted metal-binding membrane protein
MMVAMTTYQPLAITLFTASWTAGMAAMMFPAISHMVLLYNRFETDVGNKGGHSSVIVQHESRPRSFIQSLRIILFIGCYLLVWALTGIALLLGWSVVMNNTIMTAGNPQLLTTIYGALLITAGVYQFTPLKKTCLGYCESPMSFFMRRWSGGTSGAVKMGLYHGMYCLGCCWAYFLLMVALGWMNLLWMGLFAGIIFGEKIWSRGIWVARAVGAGLAVIGILVVSGMLPQLVSTATSMSGDHKMVMSDNNADSSVTMSDVAKSEPSGNNVMSSVIDDNHDKQSAMSDDGEKTPDMNMN